MELFIGYGGLERRASVAGFILGVKMAVMSYVPQHTPRALRSLDVAC